MAANAAIQYLACFCGCGQITREDVERILKLSIEEMLKDPQARVLFNRFLEQSQSGDASEAQLFLKIFLYIDDIKGRPVTEQDVENLFDMGLEYSRERELREAVRTGDADEIKKHLDGIQELYRNYMEKSCAYKDFKTALLRKLNA